MSWSENCGFNVSGARNLKLAGLGLKALTKNGVDDRNYAESLKHQLLFEPKEEPLLV